MVKCEECDTQLIEAKDLADTSRNAYLSDISKGGLTIPSREFSDFVSKVYAFLDFFYQYMGISVRHRSLVALRRIYTERFLSPLQAIFTVERLSLCPS